MVDYLQIHGYLNLLLKYARNKRNPMHTITTARSNMIRLFRAYFSQQI